MNTLPKVVEKERERERERERKNTSTHDKRTSARSPKEKQTISQIMACDTPILVQAYYCQYDVQKSKEHSDSSYPESLF